MGETLQQSGNQCWIGYTNSAPGKSAFFLVNSHQPTHRNAISSDIAFKFVYKKYAALPSDVDNLWRYVSLNLRRGCVRIQPIRPRYIHRD